MAATDGTRVVETVHLAAGQRDHSRPSSIRAASDPSGVYALVGDDLTDGPVAVGESGNTLEAVAELPADADAPTAVHVYTAAVQPGRTSDVTVRVVRGDDRRDLNRSVGVTVHAKRVAEDTILYRDEQPVTDAGTQYGAFDRHANGTVVETYTDDAGTLRVRTVNSPTVWEELVYEWRTSVPGFGLSVAPLV